MHHVLFLSAIDKSCSRSLYYISPSLKLKTKKKGILTENEMDMKCVCVLTTPCLT